MTTFIIKLAGIPVRVTALFEANRIFCKDYLCDEEPVFEAVSTPELIEAERQHSTEEISVSDAYLENLAIYRLICEQMTDYGVILSHGSAVAVDGEAYLFTAPSGTGKSTHTRLWREVLPELGHDVFMVNDDKPLIRFDGSGVYICGTPWSGKHHLDTNCMVRLRAICSLRRGETNEIRPASSESFWPVLMRQTYRVKTREHLSEMLQMLDRLTREVGLYELRCNMEPEAAIVSYEGMRRAPE